MSRTQDLLPIIRANRSVLTNWELSFLENIEGTPDDQLTRKQRDWVAIVSTRLELGPSRRPVSRKRQD